MQSNSEVTIGNNLFQKFVQNFNLRHFMNERPFSRLLLNEPFDQNSKLFRFLLYLKWFWLNTDHENGIYGNNFFKHHCTESIIDWRQVLQVLQDRRSEQMAIDFCSWCFTMIEFVAILHTWLIPSQEGLGCGLEALNENWPSWFYKFDLLPTI